MKLKHQLVAVDNETPLARNTRGIIWHETLSMESVYYQTALPRAGTTTEWDPNCRDMRSHLIAKFWMPNL